MLSLRGCQRVTLIPEIFRTRLSRKLNLRPVNSFELPKLMPQVSAGMFRLWPAAEAAMPSARIRLETMMADFFHDDAFSP